MKTYKATKHVPWIDYKTVSATQAALGVTERKAVNIPSDAYKVSEAMNFMEMRISASVSSRSGTAHVYAARKDDDISHVGDIAITSGAQVSTGDYFYVDTMVLTDKWITEVHLADENGNDGMSRIMFDVTGYDLVFVRITFTGDTVWKIGVSGL